MKTMSDKLLIAMCLTFSNPRFCVRFWAQWFYSHFIQTALDCRITKIENNHRHDKTCLISSIPNKLYLVQTLSV